MGHLIKKTNINHNVKMKIGVEYLNIRRENEI
jgi:hypothetical protein